MQTESASNSALDNLRGAVERLRETASRTRKTRVAFSGPLPPSPVGNAQNIPARSVSGVFDDVRRLAAELHEIAGDIVGDMESIDDAFHGVDASPNKQARDYA
jgi:hypothetical protein